MSYQYNGGAVGAQNDGITHVGIIAQEVRDTSLGEWTIREGLDGYLRYDPAAMTYALINAIKELDTKFDTIRSEIFATENDISDKNQTILSDTRIDRGFTHQVRRAIEQLTEYVLDMILSVREIITEKITTKELCIEDICMTREQLQEMLDRSGTTSFSSPPETGENE